MEVKLGPLRQIALRSGNLSRSIEFYRDTIGLEFIAQYDPPGLVFFRLGETRLLLELSAVARPSDAVLYFDVPDIYTAYSTLKQRGIEFDSAPPLIYRDGDGTFGLQAARNGWLSLKILMAMCWHWLRAFPRRPHNKRAADERRALLCI